MDSGKPIQPSRIWTSRQLIFLRGSQWNFAQSCAPCCGILAETRLPSVFSPVCSTWYAPRENNTLFYFILQPNFILWHSFQTLAVSSISEQGVLFQTRFASLSFDRKSKPHRELFRARVQAQIVSFVRGLLSRGSFIVIFPWLSAFVPRTPFLFNSIAAVV